MWVPDESYLKTLVDLLNQIQTPGKARQREIKEQMKKLAEDPKYYNYLVYIICNNNDSYSQETRNTAGTVFRDRLEENSSQEIDSESLEYIKAKLVESFCHDNPDILNSASALFAKLGSQNWPEFAQLLLTSLQLDNKELTETAIKSVTQVLEDLSCSIRPDETNESLFQELIPLLLTLCDLSFPATIRENALGSLNILASFKSNTFSSNINKYFEALLSNISDQDNASIQVSSCDGLTLILQKNRDLIKGNLQMILEIVLKFLTDANDQVKKEACFFLHECLASDEEDETKDILKNSLEQLVSSLLDCLELTEEDEENAQDSEDDEQQTSENADDDDQDFKDSTLREEASKLAEIIGRKFEKAAFEKVGIKFAQCQSTEDDWHALESVIFCMGLFVPEEFDENFNYKEILPILAEFLRHPESKVKSTALWAISQFAPWLVKEEFSSISSIFQIFGQSLMENDEEVQTAACSAFTRFFEEGEKLVEELGAGLLQVLAQILQKAKSINLISSIYSLISAIVTNMNPEDLSSGGPITELILHKWNEFPVRDKEAIQLLACTNSVLDVFDENLDNLAKPFIGKILEILRSSAEIRKDSYKKKVQENKIQIIMHCLELLKTFIELLSEDSSQYLNPEKCFQIVQEYLEDKDLDLRQTLFSFIQQIAISCPSLLENYVDKIAEPLIKNLDYTLNNTQTSSECCESAVLVVEELVSAYEEQFQKYIPTCAEKISQILSGSQRLDILFGRNLAIAMVRLGSRNSDAVSPYLGSFLKRYCTYAANIPDEEYVEEDFSAILQIMLKNPQVAAKNLVYVCTFLAKLKDESKELDELGSQVLNELRNIQGDTWPKFYESLPKDLQATLKDRFLQS